MCIAMEERIAYHKNSFSPLYHWGVDVEDGLSPICRGIIRDWIPRSGLIVDFLYPGHHEIHIPFRRIVGVSCREHLQCAPGDAAETIVQRSPDQPWRWYPSTVLATDARLIYLKDDINATFAFVEIDYGDEVIREVMAVDRVRRPTGPRECRRCREPIQVLRGIRALGKHLYQHAISLPDDPALLAVTRKDGFLRMWEERTGMTGAKFKEGRLAYISCYKVPISEGSMKRYLRRICGLYQAKRAAGPSVSESQGLGDLPPELMGEVFSFLDLQDQIKCRQVCHAWYSSPKWRRLVHIDLAKDRYSHGKLAVILHKTVTSSTKTLVFSVADHNYNKSGLRHAADMLKAMGSRLARIVLSERNSIDHTVSLGRSVRRDCSTFAQVSKEVLWRKAPENCCSRVFRLKEGDDELEKQWAEVALSRLNS